MSPTRIRSAATALILAACAPASAQVEPARPAAATAPAPAQAPVSFMKDVAPVLVQNCIGCHNTRKAESKYIMTTFAQLAKGGQQGEDITLEPGDPDASRFVELLRHDGDPRMPFKQDPMPLPKVALIERWVKEGAKYDGEKPDEDWTVALRKLTPAVVPESYPASVPVTALAFSPDGTTIATSGYHEVNLWKVSDGTIERRLRGLAERVYEIAYSPDGKWLATAGGDPGQSGSVKLWTAEPSGGGKPVRDLIETTDSVLAVSFSPDSKRVAAAGADRALRVWDVASGAVVAVIEDHADWVLDLAFSPDGTRIATASRDKTCKVFDIEKKESLATFPGHAQTVYAVAFQPDGKVVTSAGEDNLIRSWNAAEESKQVRQVGGFGGAIFRLQYTPDGKRLLAASADKNVRVFDTGGTSPKLTLAGHTDWVYSVAVSPDGNTAASGSWDGEVRLWSLADGKLIRSFVAAPGLKAEKTEKVSAK